MKIIFSKASELTRLARMKHAKHQMLEYITKRKPRSGQLAYMNALMDEVVVVMMITEFFGHRQKSAYGMTCQRRSQGSTLPGWCST